MPAIPRGYQSSVLYRLFNLGRRRLGQTKELGVEQAEGMPAKAPARCGHLVPTRTTGIAHLLLEPAETLLQGAHGISLCF